MTKKTIVIVDLDGTLYNSRKRTHLAQAGLWDKFHSASSLDLPNHDVADLVKFLSEECVILAITGRNEKYRPTTITWLQRWGVPVDDLLMRPDGDFRGDVEVKIQLLTSWLSEEGRLKRDIWFALDDRDKVVDGWRNFGIPCYQVRAGEF